MRLPDPRAEPGARAPKRLTALAAGLALILLAPGAAVARQDREPGHGHGHGHGSSSPAEASGAGAGGAVPHRAARAGGAGERVRGLGRGAGERVRGLGLGDRAGGRGEGGRGDGDARGEGRRGDGGRGEGGRGDGDARGEGRRGDGGRGEGGRGDRARAKSGRGESGRGVSGRGDGGRVTLDGAAVQAAATQAAVAAGSATAVALPATPSPAPAAAVPAPAVPGAAVPAPAVPGAAVPAPAVPGVDAPGPGTGGASLGGASPGGAGGDGLLDAGGESGGGAFAPLPGAAPAATGGEDGGGPRRARGDRPRTVTRTVVRTVRDVVEVVPAFAWALIGGLALACLAAAAASGYLAGRGRRLERQRAALLEDVGLLQSALLPPAPAQVAGAVASAAYVPAGGGPGGGDFHDVFAIDAERLGVVVGRVSGRGRRALGTTALVRHVLRAYLEGGLQPRNALQVGGDVLGHHLGADYACVTLAVYDAATSKLTYASAGMPAPVVHGAAAFEPVTALASPPIGMGVPTGMRQTTAVLPPGSVAAFFTDGLLDAAPDGRRTGYRGAWHAVGGLGPRDDARALVERVLAGTGASDDDVAAVLLRVGDDAPAAGPEGERRVEEIELSASDLRGERPGLFLRDCGVPTDRIGPLVADLRDTGRRLGGAVLRVRVGAGVPEAETGLRDMDVLSAPGGRATT